MSLPLWYREEDVSRLYVERGQMMAEEAALFREKHRVAPSSADSMRIAAFGIDCQVGFCHPDASLFVPGSVEDTQRIITWLYRNVSVVTELIFSLDTHNLFQIFHPAWWVDERGQHPQPLTVITAGDILSGRWRAVYAPEDSLTYCQKLEATGKYVLTVWPYHTLLGGTSHALVPALMEAAMFHSVARQQSIQFEMKGRHPETENYSVFSPEVKTISGRSVGRFHTELFRKLMTFDRVYVFGQASSHCVMASLQDLLRQIRKIQPSWVEKIWILEDAMSPVPAPPLNPLPAFLNFPAIAKQALHVFADAGMNVVKTTDPLV